MNRLKNYWKRARQAGFVYSGKQLFEDVVPQGIIRISGSVWTLIESSRHSPLPDDEFTVCWATPERLEALTGEDDVVAAATVW